MIISYANQNVEKYFTDYNKLKRKLPFEWVKKIKKLVTYMEAAEKFGDFLSLQLGKPERLTGYEMRYSLHIDRNVRLIIEPIADGESVLICSEVEIEGVCDYHGDKENWFIS